MNQIERLLTSKTSAVRRNVANIKERYSANVSQFSKTAFADVKRRDSTNAKGTSAIQTDFADIKQRDFANVKGTSAIQRDFANVK